MEVSARMSTDGHGSGTSSQADFSTSDDSEDVNRQRRLNAIHDARETVVDRRRRVDDALTYNEITEQTANTVLRREVENYIHEVEWLMDDADTSRDYWAGVELGAMVMPDGNTYEFVGLQSIVETADPIHYQWESEEEDDWDGRTVNKHEETVQIPRDVLMNAYRAVNGFLFEIGLDLGLDDGPTEYGFDYSDLLKPGEEDPRQQSEDDP